MNFIIFQLEKKSPLINHYLINNQNHLNTMITAFKETFIQLIELANKNRIIYPSSFKDEVIMLPKSYKGHCQSLPLVVRDTFTKREKECSLYIKKGLSVKEIANNLLISPRTVEKYIVNLRAKMNSSSIRQLIIKLSENNILD